MLRLEEERGGGESWMSLTLCSLCAAVVSACEDVTGGPCAGGRNGGVQRWADEADDCTRCITMINLGTMLEMVKSRGEERREEERREEHSHHGKKLSGQSSERAVAALTVNNLPICIVSCT
jgi:hypothetical protein